MRKEGTQQGVRRWPGENNTENVIPLTFSEDTGIPFTYAFSLAVAGASFTNCRNAVSR